MAIDLTVVELGIIGSVSRAVVDSRAPDRDPDRNPVDSGSESDLFD